MSILEHISFLTIVLLLLILLLISMLIINLILSIDLRPYDPEGFLGVLSATTLTYLGLTCGRVLQHTPDWKQRVKEWVSMGLFLLFVAGKFLEFGSLFFFSLVFSSYLHVLCSVLLLDSRILHLCYYMLLWVLVYGFWTANSYTGITLWLTDSHSVCAIIFFVICVLW